VRSPLATSFSLAVTGVIRDVILVDRLVRKLDLEEDPFSNFQIGILVPSCMSINIASNVTKLSPQDVNARKLTGIKPDRSNWSLDLCPAIAFASTATAVRQA
jgi:hypothetical protein